MRPMGLKPFRLLLHECQGLERMLNRTTHRLWNNGVETERNWLPIDTVAEVGRRLPVIDVTVAEVGRWLPVIDVTVAVGVPVQPFHLQSDLPLGAELPYSR